MSDKKKDRRERQQHDDTAKWVGFGAGAALGSAALAAAVLYASRARDRQREAKLSPKAAEAED